MERGHKEAFCEHMTLDAAMCLRSAKFRRWCGSGKVRDEFPVIFYTLFPGVRKKTGRGCPHSIPYCNRRYYNYKEDEMEEPNPNKHKVGRYKSTRAVFKENPQMASQVLATIADVLDRGDCAEIKKCRDGTPKVIQVRREIKS